MATPESKKVDINLLEFDPQNPRLPHHINGRDERQVINWMLKDSGLLELLISIATQGYFSGEPLLAIPLGNKYTIVEGNRRLAALKLLKNPGLATERPKAIALAIQEANFASINEVPVIIYPNRSDILSYLGYRHVTGIKEWEPLEKARYIEQLNNSPEFANFEPEQRYLEIAKVIGSRRDYVQKLLAGLRLYYKIEKNNFFGIQRNFEENPISFSLLTTALGYSKIVDFLGLESPQDIQQISLDINNLEYLARWMYEEDPVSKSTKLGESRNLRKLNAVVANKEALAAFANRGYTLEAAAEFTDEPLDTYRTLVVEAKGKINLALGMLTQLVDRTETDDIRNIEELLRSLRAMKRLVEPE